MNNYGELGEISFYSYVTGKTITLLAYITDMAQSFSSTWNTEDVFGRTDPIAMFAGTKRTISLAIDIPSANSNEASENLKKCSKLASFLYPGYKKTYKKSSESSDPFGGSNGTGLSISANIVSPPLVGINFNNLISGDAGGFQNGDSGEITVNEGNDSLMGYFDSYNFSPVMESGYFFGDTDLFPRTISITLSFNALHRKTNGFVLEDEEIQWTGDSFFGFDPSE